MVILKTNRSAYAPEQIEKTTITVGELIKTTRIWIQCLHSQMTICTNR